MRFHFNHYTATEKAYAIIAELIEVNDQHETWKICQRHTPDKYILAISDRPTNKNERFNWTVDGKEPEGYQLKQVIRTIEWRQYFTINDGYAGIHVKDDF